MSESNYTRKEDCFECDKTMYDDEEITEGVCEICGKFFCRECTSTYSGLIMPEYDDVVGVMVDVCGYCNDGM